MFETETEDDMDKRDSCPFCGRVATTEYEGQPSCGRAVCEYKMQAGLDYINERGG